MFYSSFFMEDPGFVIVEALFVTVLLYQVIAKTAPKSF